MKQLTKDEKELLDKYLREMKHNKFASGLIHKEMGELRTRLSDLSKVSQDIREKAALFAPIKIGQRVTLNSCKNIGSMFNPRWVKGEGFISKIKAIVKDDEFIFRYDINGIKLNGEMSKKPLSRYVSKALPIDEFEIVG